MAVTAWMDGWLIGSLDDLIASAVALTVTVTVTARMDECLLGSLAYCISSAVAVTNCGLL